MVSDSWLKQPNESPKAHKAFRTYLELGSNRSIDKAYCATKGLQEGSKRAAGLWMDWCSKFNWVDRAADYDLYMRMLEQQQREADTKAQAASWIKRRDDLREEEIDIAQKLIAQARQMLEFPITRQTIIQDGYTTIIEPADWKKSDIPRFIETADKLQRLSLEMETERVLFEQDQVANKITDTILDVVQGFVTPEVYDHILQEIRAQTSTGENELN